MKRLLGIVLFLATIPALATGCYVRDRGAVVVHDDHRYDEHRYDHHEEHHDDHHEDHDHHDDHRR